MTKKRKKSRLDLNHCASGCWITRKRPPRIYAHDAVFDIINVLCTLLFRKVKTIYDEVFDILNVLCTLLFSMLCSILLAQRIAIIIT